MTKQSKKAVVTIVILIFVAAAFIFIRPGWYLTLRHGTSGEVLARYPVEQQSSFSVGFIHSVNKSPFIDVYRIDQGDIVLDETIYYSFGAGVETEVTADETLVILEDNAMLLGNMNRPVTDSGVTYIVGSYSEHTLVVGDILTEYPAIKDSIGVFTDELTQETDGGLLLVSLSEFMGRHTPINFTCSFRLWG